MMERIVAGNVTRPYRLISMTYKNKHIKHFLYLKGLNVIII